MIFFAGFLDRIRRPADQMAMNPSAASYRRITEKEIIDQTLPYFVFGKGGLAKTIRDKGQFSALEYIGVPSPLLNEIHGLRDSKKTTIKCPIMHNKWFKKHSWHIIKRLSSTKVKCAYKAERMKPIDPLVAKLFPHRPDVRELAVIGNII
ncbi:hypothetical protein ECG_04979 [Echinococcus granulosus]|nr:hypothetical protein ECG_04979 [Echinococcus granulosus]